MEEIAALIPGAKYRLVPASGHMLPVEQPTVVSALLRDFLEEHVR
jgi:pimeloyl-ACP methyl ester carboxylesterase